MKNKRKPDFENESFRCWTPTEEEKEKFKNSDDETSFKISYKDMEISCHGFSVAVDKKTKKKMFAFKFKHDDKLILYYNPSGDEELIEKIKLFSSMFGYACQDVQESLKRIYNEKHIIDKLNNSDEKKKNSVDYYYKGGKKQNGRIQRN